MNWRKYNAKIGGAIILAVVLFVIFSKPLIENWAVFSIAVASIALHLALRRFHQGRANRAADTGIEDDLPACSPDTPPKSPVIQTPMAIQPKVQERIVEERTSLPPGSDDELRSTLKPEIAIASQAFIIPPAPVAFEPTRWVSKSETITIAGITIHNAFLYVGPNLNAANGSIDPALIDSRRKVGTIGHYTERLVNFWPSYVEISPEARRAYLLWLADGRSAPNADIGYVFLYFYGLERRIIIDILANGMAPDELPLLARELTRLYSTYAKLSDSFKNFCGKLLELVAMASSSSKTYEDKFDIKSAALGMPFALRLAIGHAVRDGVPIPAHIALAWAECEPTIQRRTPVWRCAKEFRALFAAAYATSHGAGIVVAPGETGLTIGYRPASGGFAGTTEIAVQLGAISDVTTLTTPVMQLQNLVDACCDLLADYSRYLARYPEGRNDLEALLALPKQLWPDTMKVAFANIQQRVSGNLLRLTFKTLFAELPATGELNKDSLIALVTALESEGVAIEPDVLGAPGTIKPDDPLVLFASVAPSAECRKNPAFKVGRISVELAAAVAHADGDFSDDELQHLNTYIDRWEHLPAASRLRLRMYAQLLVHSSVTLSSIKKKVELLNKPTREAIAAFAAAMVLADGVAAPEEVKILEKIYLQLGLEKTSAYSAIHAAHATARQPSETQDAAAIKTPSGFSLDAAKIAALKESSDRIALRLAEIFADEADEAPLLQPAPPAPQAPQAGRTLLGLDAAHTAFARMLMSRSSWQKAELSDIARSLNIMLDGALEKINEASLDALDTPFTDGDDPVDINPEMNERLAQ